VLALLLIPLLGATAFAAAEVHERAASASHARQAQSLLTTATQLSKVRSAVLQESVPRIARTIVSMPALAGALGLSTAATDDLGLVTSTIPAMQRRTDQSLAALARDARARQLAQRLAPQVTLMRRQIDSGIGMVAGYNTALSIVRALAAAEHRDVVAAIAAGIVGAANNAARDLESAAEVVQLADLELPAMTSNLYPTLAGAEPGGQSATQYWMQVWGGYQSSLQNLLAGGTPPLVHALRAALRTPAAKTVDTIAAAAVDDPHSVTAVELATMYRYSQQRSAALDTVIDLAERRALSAAAGQLHSAVASLWAILAVVLALALASGLVGWWLLRSITRPLRSLAASARQVSEGVLDDVAVGGPHEIRTAAHGLAAAVASLRKVEAQAAAVSAGKLDSDVVREPLPGPLGEVMHASVETIIGAIHERDAAQTDLAYRAAHDGLTDLPNRSQAMAAIEGALHRARRSGVMTGLMFVDLDRFKAVNDSFGHEAGDEVLRQTARRMQRIVRAGDTVARLGGDEFVILVENLTDEAGAVELAGRVVADLAAPMRVGRRQIRVGASVGLAVCVDNYVDASRLLSEADAAAYRAKQAGRGRVSVFDDALRDELTRRADLETAIADGLERGEFVLHYQPVVDLRTGRPRGAEALIRWNRPGHGLVPPADFIPTAEESRLINDIGRWTLREAAAQLARWDAELGRRDLTVAVNISGRHLVSDELVADVRTALDAAGIGAHRLVVEVTETVLVDDLSATRNLTALREMGVRVSIDDFGTGFTSIGQLLSLPVDELKIDRSFVASTDPAQLELVELMARAAHAFGLHVVAEGVEEAVQLDRLAGCAVESAQGFHFAYPQPADETLALVRLPALPVPARHGLPVAGD
jgi:diguanylate cyclase (GGDEF)-like protein